MGIAGVVAGPRLGTPATLGVAGVGVGTDFVSLTTLWRAYRRQRYRSWSSADAEGPFCVVCVQFLALCRRWAEQASLLGQVLDCRRRRECTQWCWSASVWQVGIAREVMSPIPTHYRLFRFWCVGAVRFHSLFQSHTESNRTAYTPKCEEPVSLTSAYIPAIRLICAVRLAGISG